MKKLHYTVLLLLSVVTTAHAQPGWLWGVQPVSSGGVSFTAITADGAGNVFTAGIIQGADSTRFGASTIYGSTGARDIYVAKANAGGAFQWVLAAQTQYNNINGIAADAVGNLYVLGSYFMDTAFTLGSASAHSDSGYFGAIYALLKISPAGSVIWAQNVVLQNLALSTYNLHGSVNVDADGNVYVSGMFTGGSEVVGGITVAGDTSGWGTLFVAKYNSSGSAMWATSIPGGGNYNFITTTSTNGTTYIMGDFLGWLTAGSTVFIDTSSTMPETYIAKINNNGSVAWAVADPSQLYSYTAITSDAQDRLYLGGYFGVLPSYGVVYASDTFPYHGFPMCFVACLDSSSGFSWANAAYHMQTINKMCTDKCGNIGICGGTGRIIGNNYPIFGTDTLVLPDSALYSLAAVLSPAGNFLAATALSNSYSFSAFSLYSICADDRGNFFTSGEAYTTAWSAGPDSMARGAYLAKYHYDDNPCSAEITEVHSTPASAHNISLYPNPTTGLITIASEEPFATGSTVELYDIAGRRISTYSLSGSSATLSFTGITPGMYFCRIMPSGGDVVVKKVVVQ